jgi:hypothetical protein
VDTCLPREPHAPLLLLATESPWTLWYTAGWSSRELLACTDGLRVAWMGYIPAVLSRYSVKLSAQVPPSRKPRLSWELYRFLHNPVTALSVSLTLLQKVFDLVGIEVAYRDVVQCGSIRLGSRRCACSFTLGSPSIAWACRWWLRSSAVFGGGVRARVAFLGLTVPLSWPPPAITHGISRVSWARCRNITGSRPRRSLSE